MNKQYFHLLLFLGTLATFPSLVRAEHKVFAVDPAQSLLTLSGSLSGFGVTEQGNGSLTTSYSGTVTADVTDKTIEFLNGESLVTAAISGNWQPQPGGALGFAPANYGAQVFLGFSVARAALRNIEFELTSPAIDLAAESFPADELTFSFPENSTAALDFNAGQDVGTSPLAGSTTNNVLSTATLTTTDGLMTLTVPVDYAFELEGDRPGQFRFVGAIVAKEVKPLLIGSFDVTGALLNFTFDTTPGKTYKILGSNDLTDFSIEVDQFTATESQTNRSISRSPALGQFFILTEE